MPGTKLPSARDEAIRRLYRNGKKTKQLAKMFKLSCNRIHRIVSWHETRHIEP
jgi:Mor family transcriptional regulator